MIFVDANILLEVVEKRAHATACEQLLRNKDEKAISTLTLDLAMYFVEKDKLDWGPVRTFLDSFIWLPVVDADAHWAFNHFKGKDFEDALQVSCAKRESCHTFATLDKALAKKYADVMPVQLLS